MKLREQATLWCKMLALLCVVLGLNTLPQIVPQLFGFYGFRKLPFVLETLLGASMPAILMSVFGAAIWFLSPFIAALMVPDATLQKLENENSAPSAPIFGGREALTCGMILVGLWLCFQSFAALGRVAVTRTIIANQTASSSSMTQYYDYQIGLELAHAAIGFIFGALLLALAKPVARRVFPQT